ncbi:MAG TPA: UbiA family prenyltransferase [Solirubrobacteraceae bacterium]|jgi:4-hydroxybenzoate polyprenyltransferase|nr:UbiA family prenyltransferase [Solirubrobacteraceae bacterium]
MSSADVAAPRRGRVGVGHAWLRLARISNSPTVVSDVVAGAVLADAGAEASTIALVAVAMALFYTAGMIANDVFDLDVDRRARPERPLPSGLVSVRAAIVATIALFATGEGLLLAVDVPAGLAGLGLIALIVLYDAWHKGNALSPLLMGGCRAMVYVLAALAVAGGTPSRPVAGAALLLLVLVVGMTQVAKAEGSSVASWWPVAAVLAPAAYWCKDLPSSAVAGLLVVFVAFATHALWLGIARRAIGRSVGRLIATIALLDALAVAASGGAAVAVAVCVAAFAATLAMQTRIAGT